MAGNLLEVGDKFPHREVSRFVVGCVRLGESGRRECVRLFSCVACVEQIRTREIGHFYPYLKRPRPTSEAALDHCVKGSPLELDSYAARLKDFSYGKEKAWKSGTRGF